MDYKKDSLITIAISDLGGLYRYYCAGYDYSPHPVYPASFKSANQTPCPACGSSDPCIHFGDPDCSAGMNLCLTCRIIWKVRFGLACQACGKPLDRNLLCYWCGQKWELSVLTDIYSLHDEGSMVDPATAKGANL